MFRSIKALFLFLLLPSFSYAASLTAQQTTQAAATSLVVEKDAQALFAFAYSVDKLVKNGYVYQVTYTTNPVINTMTAQQQQDIVNYYQALKQQLQADFLTLP